ncbi:L-2-amino-thiazoline-4-carboxylic acid hydrolase [Spirochaetota bacterium]
MAEEEKDIYFGAPPEIVEYAKEAVAKMGGMLGLIVEAAYEEWGEKAIEVMGEAVKKDAREKGARFREEEGYKPEDVDVEIALTEIYPKSHGALAVAGLDFERVMLEKDKSESRVHVCGLLDGYMVKSDKPWLLCEIFARYHDEGFMEGVNPKLEWVAHVEKNGGEGLARGKDKPCILKLKLNK